MDFSRTSSRKRALIVFLFVAAYFLALTWKGLFYDFNPDDTMNMYLAWVKSYGRLVSSSLFAVWLGEMRPIGALFYKTIHHLCGFSPLPFRAACFALLLVNLWLQFSLFRRLTNSFETATLALLVGTFNGALWAIYASTGTVYDVLCQFFVLLSMICYVRMASSDGWKRTGLYVGCCVAAVCAIQSKEMGFAIPLLLLAYEACYAIPAAVSSGKPLPKVGVTALLKLLPVGLVGGLAAYGMISARHVLFVNPGYTPHFSWKMYLQTSAAHLTLLSFRAWTVSEGLAVIILAGSLASALLMRSRVAVFGWLFFNLSLLPISFVPARQDGYVLYIPYIGFSLYFGGIAERLAGYASQLLSRRLTQPMATLAVYCGLTMLVMSVQVYEQPYCQARGFGPGGHSLVRDLALTAGLPSSASAQRVVLVDDPWGAERWQPGFIVRLSRGAKDLDVVRITSADLSAGNTFIVGPRDQVLRYSEHMYRELSQVELIKLGFKTKS